MPSRAVFYVPALVSTLITLCVGGLLVVTAWIQVLIEPPPEAPRKIGRALLAFTAAVMVDAIVMPVVWQTPEEQKAVVWTWFLLVSFACAIAGRLYVIRGFGPSKSIVKFGSMILVIVDFLGFLGIISGLPKLF
jgi:hypothetical protein